MWCSKEFEDLIQKAKTTPDQAERTKLYEQAQVVFKAEEPGMTLAHSKVFMPMHKRVRASSWIRWATIGLSASTSPTNRNRTAPVRPSAALFDTRCSLTA